MIQPASTILYGVDDQVRDFFIFSSISLCCHLLIFVLIVFVHFPTDLDFKIKTPPAIDVDLVSFNPEIPLPPPKVENSIPVQPDRIDRLIDKVEKMPDRPELNQPEPETLRAKKTLKKKLKSSDYVVEKPTKKVKKPHAKKKINTAKILEEAVKRIERQAETSRPKSVADRIERLKKEVKNQSGTKGISSTSAGSDGPFPKDFSQLEIYQAEVSVRLKNNWVFSEKLAGDTKGLESRLVIKILPDGRITDVWFEKRSGNTYLDNSAYKTVMKSNPLPPLPAGIAYFHLVLGFTPTGLNR
jgi:colicin import membrane protein